MIFDIFALTDYTFLQLDSKSGGNQIVEEYEASGVVKLRDGMIQTDNMETLDSSSTIHIKPTEPFASDLDGDLVGHGIRVVKDGKESVYRIEGQVEGFDYDTGELEFYKVTLKKENLWETSDLPLE